MIKKTPDKSSFAFLIFCLWAFVLVSRPQDLFPFLVPLRPALVTSALTLAAVLACYKYLPDKPLLQNNQVKLYLALYSVMIVGIPFAIHVRRSFEIVITQYIVAVLFVCIFFKLINSIERLKKVLLVCCLGSGLYFLYTLSQFTPGDGRIAFGTMFDPNDLAFFALAFLPINILFFSRTHSIWVRLTCLSCLILGLMLIFLSGSRGGFLGFCVAAIILLFFSKVTLNLFMKIAFVLGCVSFLLFSNVDTERFITILSIEDDYNIQSDTGRLEIWKIGFKYLMANPLTGVGVGNFSKAIGDDREQRGLIPRWQSPHSSVVQIGTETGFIGLFLYLFISFNVFRVFFKIKNKSQDIMLIKVGEMALAGFAGMFTAGLFLTHAYSIYWAFYVVLSAVLNQLHMKEGSAGVSLCCDSNPDILRVTDNTVKNTTNKIRKI